MKTKIIAVIGCGSIADAAHFPSLTSIDNVRIKYACDLIEERAAAMKEKYPDKVEQVITDYHVALRDPEVEAVYVLTPNHAHYTITMDALRAGKHVFCEKPVAVKHELACEMAAEAHKQNKLLNIGVCNRFDAAVQELARRVAAGEFGNIYHVYCSFRAWRAIPGLGGPFTTKSLSGGGVLIDWGIHYFDLILYVLGGAKLINVTCDTYNKIAKDMKSYRYKNMYALNTSDIENGTNDVDDFVTGYIRTDRASISFNGSWAQNIPGKVEFYIDFLGDKAGARLKYGADFTTFNGETLESETVELPHGQMYRNESVSFLNCIETGEKDSNHIDNILESSKLVQMLYDSAEIRKEISAQ